MKPHRAIGKLLGEARDVARGATRVHAHLRDRVFAIMMFTIAVDLVCTVAVFFLERHGQNTDIHTLGSSLFWTSGQLLTVSSQMTNPVTTGGRIIDIAMEAYAITVVASLAATFGVFLHHRSPGRRP